MGLKLPRLGPAEPITDNDRSASLAFGVVWQQLVESLETAIDIINATLTDIITLNDLITSANAAIDDANTAIADANAAIADANANTAAIAAADALANSYVSGCTITATDAGTDVTIDISSHTRYYPQADGTTVSVSVDAGSVTGQPYSTFLYVYYDDPARAGGTVTYLTTTSEVTAAQTGDRHTVGSVTTPAALGAPAPGKVVLPSGPGAIQ